MTFAGGNATRQRDSPHCVGDTTERPKTARCTLPAASYQGVRRIWAACT
jgi:hypothetical protein